MNISTYEKKRILLAIFATIPDDPPAEPAGGDPAGDPAAPQGGDPPPVDPPAGDPPAGEGAPKTSWMDGIEGITDEHREALKDMTPEQVLEKLTSKGPEAPEEYSFELPEGINKDDLEGEAFDQFTGGLGEIAKKHGLSQDALSDILGYAAKFDVDRSQNFVQEMQEHNKRVFADGLAQMKKDLGASEAQKTFTLAKATMKAFADEGLWEFLNSTGLGDSPDLIRLFARVGESVSEDHGIPPATAGSAARKQGEVPRGLYNKSDHT